MDRLSNSSLLDLSNDELDCILNQKRVVVLNNNNMKFDSKNQNFENFLQRFDYLIESYNYNDKQKAVELIKSLDEPTFNLLLQFPKFVEEKQNLSYTEIVNYLKRRLNTKNNVTYLIELSECSQRVSEKLEAFVGRLNNLVRNAYNNNDKIFQETMLKTQFLKGVIDKNIKEVILNNMQDSFENIVTVTKCLNKENIQVQIELLNQNMQSISVSGGAIESENCVNFLQKQPGFNGNSYNKNTSCCNKTNNY